MKKRIPYDHWIILSLTVLLSMGIVVVYNASTSRRLIIQTAAIFLGLLLIFLITRIRYYVLDRELVVYLLASLATGLLLIPIFFFDPVNGARRWIRLFGNEISFQPSELGKIVLIILTAHFLAAYHRQGKNLAESNRSLQRQLYIYLFFVLLIIALVLIGKDLSTAALMVMTILVMLFLGGLRLPLIFGVTTAGLGIFLLLIFSEGYRARRLSAFLNPEADPQGAGYHTFQSLIYFGAGGISGEGFQSGGHKFDFLPEAHTDFIFSAIGHETGLMGCLVVLSFFVIFVYRGLKVGNLSDTKFGTFLGLGLASAIGLQAFLNMSVALSLFPTTGLPLPFVSYGGTSVLMMMLAAGILLDISASPREPERSRKKKDKELSSSYSPLPSVSTTGMKAVYRQADLPWEERS